MDKYSALYNEKLGELIAGKMFPVESIIMGVPTFNMHVLGAIRIHTESTLECPLDEYEGIYKCATGNSGVWSMSDIYTALLALKSVTPKVFTDYMGSGYSTEDWIEAKQVWNALSTEWETLVAPYMNEAMKHKDDAFRRDQREADVKKRILR